MQPQILLTVDVEDWFQVENFKRYIPFSSWENREFRVERSTHELLDLFDTQCLPRATFFILGWIAERLPGLVREIHNRGHEVASHGYYHELSNGLNHQDLRSDLSDSKKYLEDILGNPIYGFRAPSFAINNTVLRAVEECGYLYDSSYNSFEMHGRYGSVDLDGYKRTGIAIAVSKCFYELPISNLQIQGLPFELPWGGGGYFRLIPYMLFRMGVKQILKNKHAYLFYMHPWEIDHKQPRMKSVSAFLKFRHYINLKRTSGKLSSLIRCFNHCRFIACRQYIQDLCDNS